jgi:hypothetical protein
MYCHTTLQYPIPSHTLDDELRKDLDVGFGIASGTSGNGISLFFLIEKTEQIYATNHYQF